MHVADTRTRVPKSNTMGLVYHQSWAVSWVPGKLKLALPERGVMWPHSGTQRAPSLLFIRRLTICPPSSSSHCTPLSLSLHVRNQGSVHTQAMAEKVISLSLSLSLSLSPCEKRRISSHPSHGREGDLSHSPSPSPSQLYLYMTSMVQNCAFLFPWMLICGGWSLTYLLFFWNWKE